MEDETTMAQEEEQTRNYRSSKKHKQKKIPQRGLGVAQLEKIIGEQQQHIRDGTIILPSLNSSNLPLPPINNFNHSNQPSSTIPLHSGSLAEFRSTPLSLQHHIDPPKVSNTVPLPKFWSSNEMIDFEKDNFGVEQRLPFLPSLPFESNPIWPLPNWVQRTSQYHQPSSPMVNISSGTPSIPVSHLAIEPPSNQNFSSNGAPGPVKPPEKVIGMKRPYPFSLDYPLAPAFNYNKLPAFAERSADAKTLSESEIGYHFVAPNPTSREVPPSSASKSEPISKKRNKGVKNFDGHFLTLATPSSISHSPSQMNSSTSLAFQKQECSDSASPFNQENIEDQFSTSSSGYRLLNQQKQTLYSFFIPPAKETQNVQTTARTENCYEVEGSIDLNLKL